MAGLPVEALVWKPPRGDPDVSTRRSLNYVARSIGWILFLK
jgi:hypothetical protein